MDANSKVRFGIVATGKIAEKFAATAPLVRELEVRGVASRTKEKAQAFSGRYGIAKAYSNYDALYNDPEIDAVYIATPHSHHKECCLKAIAAGKHVLCEKPMALCQTDAQEIFQAARQCGVFVMEAMWTRFIPTILHVKEWIDSGKIGDIRYLQATFGFQAKEDPESRLFNPKLAGGALYDVGVYAISLMLDFMKNKKVLRCHGLSAPTFSGVDGLDVMQFYFEDGAIAQLTASITCQMESTAVIYGTQGKIRLLPRFYCPNRVELWQAGKLVESYNLQLDSGFEYEMRHVCQKILSGATVSDRMAPEETIACARVFDLMQAEWDKGVS